MDPFDSQFRRRRVNVQAILAFVVGIIVAYLLQISFKLGGGNLFTALIVIAVGGFWYHLRRVV
jgi:hypothetical protein